MVASMRDLLGQPIGTPHREAISAVDTDAPDSSAFKAAVTPLVILGHDRLYLQAKHDDGSGTLSIAVCYYNKDDDLLAVSNVTSLDASAVALDSGDFISELKGTDGAEPRAYAARVLVTALTNSTDVDLFVTYNDGHNRR